MKNAEKMNSRFVIRPAEEKDTEVLLRIYGQYIDTPVTFEYELPDVKEFSERIRRITEKYPYLVCVDGDRPVGYAYAHRQRERAAYQWNAELSVYIDREYVSMGIGTRLYAELIKILKHQGIKNVYAGVTVPNEKSERLHEKMGFKRIGIYHHTGYKCGRWYDVVWFERQISDCEEAPGETLRPYADAQYFER